MNKKADKISPMEIKFCMGFVKTNRKGASAAAAGYNKTQSSKTATLLLRKPMILEYIEELKAKLANKGIASAAKVLREVTLLAESNMADYVEFRAGKLKLKSSSELTRDQMSCIRSIEWGKKGLKLKLYDKLEALDKLGRYHDLFNKTTQDNTGSVRFDVHVHKH